jgi:hypothetical protein
MSEREEAIEKLWNSWHELLEIGERFGFARMHETIDGLEGTEPRSLLKVIATAAVIERHERRQLTDGLGDDPVLN